MTRIRLSRSSDIKVDGTKFLPLVYLISPPTGTQYAPPLLLFMHVYLFIFLKAAKWSGPHTLSVSRPGKIRENIVGFKWLNTLPVSSDYSTVFSTRTHHMALVHQYKAHISTSSCIFTIHGHRTSKAPHPVRSAQLTGVPLS